MPALPQVSDLFDPERWRPVPGFEGLTDLTYHRAVAADGADQGTVRVAFDRPEVRNAFRPHTVDELYRVLDHARMSSDVGCVLLTGNGPSPKDGGHAFCSGGDQRIRGRTGYQYEAPAPADEGSEGTAGGSGGGGAPPEDQGTRPDRSTPAEPDGVGGPAEPDGVGGPAEPDGVAPDPRLGRLHILEVQRLIRMMPKVVVCLVNGWAAGGGHSLHVVCDLTIASREHGRFKQTDLDVASFDGGFGSAYLAKQVGQKFAREIFFLGQEYSAEDGHRMGTVNRVVPHADLEATGLQWGEIIAGKSPTAVRMLKFSMNLTDDGMVGQQVFAGEATRLAYMTDEAQEGRDAFLEKRAPDWSGFPYHF